MDFVSGLVDLIGARALATVVPLCADLLAMLCRVVGGGLAAVDGLLTEIVLEEVEVLVTLAHLPLVVIVKIDAFEGGDEADVVHRSTEDPDQV